MDSILSNDEILDNLSSEFDMLLPEEETVDTNKPVLDTSFLDSLLHNDSSEWSEVFSQLSPFHHFDDDMIIKSEPGDSPRSYSEGSDSSDEKFVLDTPPISPPRIVDMVQVPSQSFCHEKKRAILNINPNSIKIIKNVKGFKPMVKHKQIILPKEVFQKVINCKSSGRPESKNGKVKLTESTLIQDPRQIGTFLLPPNHCPRNMPGVSEAKLESVGPPIAPSPFTVCQVPDNGVRSDLNLKALKRQQRMIKNRESACLSRKKKKDYVISLENRVDALEKDNKKLREENELLHARIKELGYSGFGKSNTFLNTNLRKTTALLAVLLMVSINIGSLNLLTGEGLNRDGDMRAERFFPPVTVKKGRALLWANSDLDDSKEKFSNAADSKSVCPVHINQTESLRLEKELRRWIAVDEKRGRYRNSTSSREPPLDLRLPLSNSHRLKAFKGQRTQRRSTNAVGLYRPPFPGSLPRRDDTFYVFSFSSDHLLIPALSHDKTLRPKVSFVVPSIPLNDSVINGSIPMMQLDCEVLATRSVELTEKDFKLFKPREEGKPKNNSNPQVTFKEGSYRPYFVSKSNRYTEQDTNFDNYIKKVYRTSKLFL